MAKRFAAISKSKEVMRRSRKDATAQDTSANKRMGQMKAWHHFTTILLLFDDISNMDIV